jgi:hypothetical protein
MNVTQDCIVDTSQLSFAAGTAQAAPVSLSPVSPPDQVQCMQDGVRSCGCNHEHPAAADVSQAVLEFPDCALHVAPMLCSCILSKRVSRYRTACLYGGVIFNVGTSHSPEEPLLPVFCA